MKLPSYLSLSARMMNPGMWMQLLGTFVFPMYVLIWTAPEISGVYFFHGCFTLFLNCSLFCLSFS